MGGPKKTKSIAKAKPSIKNESKIKPQNEEAQTDYIPKKRNFQQEDEIVVISESVARRGLYLLVFILFTLMLINLSGSLVLFFSTEKIEHPYACTKPNCIRMSKWLLEGLDRSIDPCDDFYAFACNKWIKAHPPKAADLTFTFSNGIPFNFQANQMLGSLLKRVKGHPLDQFLIYFQACLNSDMKNRVRYEPFVNMLAQLNLLYPFTGGKQANLAKIIVSLSKTEKELLTIPASDYASVMKKSFTLLSKELLIEDLTEIDSIVYLVMKFEAELTLVQSKGAQTLIFGFPDIDSHVKRPEVFHKNFYETTASFSWEDFMVELFHYRDMKNITIFFNYYNSFLTKEDRYYSHAIRELLTKTPYYTISRYFQWSLIKVFGFEMTSEIKDLMLNVFRWAGTGRVERCFRSIFVDLHILASERYKHHISDHEELKQSMENIIKIFHTILSEIGETLPKTIGDSFKETLRTMNIAAPLLENITDNLKTYYTGLDLNVNMHFANVIQCRTIKARNGIKGLRKIPPFNFWQRGTYSVDEVTQQYFTDSVGTKRVLSVPFGSLQEPYFSNDLRIFNYAGFGYYVLAYYLSTYCMNDVLTKQSKIQNQIQTQGTGETNQLEQDLQPRFDCVYKSYSQMSLKGLPDFKLNPKSPPSKVMNFVDPAAIQLIFKVISEIKNDSKEYPNYQILPGLEEFKPEQLAFLSIAREVCFTASDERKKFLLEHGPTPHEIRINGPLRNSEAFSKAFKCNKNKWMNPSEKCNFFKL